MYFSFALKYLPLSLGALLCLTSCDEVCDKDEQPQLHLTTSQREWTNPYEQGATWRFRSAAGYEQTYRVKEFKDEMVGTGGGKSSFCPSFYYQFIEILLERTDSSRVDFNRFSMKASSNYRDLSFGNSFYWNGQSYGLPITEVDAGMMPSNYSIGSTSRVLPQLAAGGHIYQNVVESTLTPAISNPLPPSAVLRVFITKANGVIRFETKAGTVWDRQ